jgi:hypothetical protein
MQLGPTFFDQVVQRRKVGWDKFSNDEWRGVGI